jgi:hypothetical protein
MLDIQVHLQKLRSDADECAFISRNATDLRKRELFARLAEHLNRLAQEVEREMGERETAQESVSTPVPSP